MLQQAVAEILINKVPPPPLYENAQLGIAHAPVRTAEELACTLFKPYDIFALLAVVKTLFPFDVIAPPAVILPVVEILAPDSAPACAIDALAPVPAPTANPPDPTHDILLHGRAPVCDILAFVTRVVPIARPVLPVVVKELCAISPVNDILEVVVVVAVLYVDIPPTSVICMPPHPIMLVVFICPLDKIFTILFTESDLVVNLPTLSIVAREFIFKELALTLPVLSIVAKEFIFNEFADTEGAVIAPVDDIICDGEAALPTFRLLLIHTKGVTT